MARDNDVFCDKHRAERPSTIIMSVVADIAHYLAMAQERRRQRRALARLDHHLLRDIGLSADAVSDETHRPFWR